MKCTVTLAERAFAVKKTMKDMHALHKINECERFFFSSCNIHHADKVHDGRKQATTYV